MKILLFTFRTNPFIEDLQKKFKDIFIFGNLKKDIEEFKRIIEEYCPEFIIGIGNSDKSCFERKAINRFNSKHIPGSKSEFELFVPPAEIGINDSGTTSFCNWTTYKISDFLFSNKKDSKLIFIHFKKEDYSRVDSYLGSLI